MTSQRLVVLGVGVVYLLTSFAFAKVIYPIDDEAVFANPAYNLVTHGRFGLDIVEHVNTLKGIESHTYWFQPLFSLLLSGWFLLAPPSLMSQRLFSVAWGLVALSAWFLVSLRLTRNVWCAATIALALALDYVFLAAAGTGRMDMMSAALSWLGVALYLETRNQLLPCAVFLACGACALNVVTHPIGAIVGAVNLVIIFVLLDRARFRLALLLPAALPFTLVGTLWAAYIAQNPDDFVSQFLSNVNLTGPAGEVHRLSGLAHPLSALWTMAGNVVQGLYGPVDLRSRAVSVKVLIPFAYLTITGLAVAYPAVRRKLEVRAILLFCLADFVLLALLNSRGKVHYFVHVMPLLTVLTVLVAGRSQRLPGVARFTVFACCIVLLILNGARIVHSVYDDAYRTRYRPVQLVLWEVIPPTASVFAQAEWAFTLGFERMLHDDSLGFRSGKRPGYIVVDGKQQDSMDSYARAFPVARQYFQTLLTQDYALVYQDSLVRIYRRRAPP